MPPKISIIIPNYNLGNFLEHTLSSVESQNYSNIEVILVDGGSTDNSLDVIKKYADLIDVLIIEPDEGQADALNKGFRRATGDVLCWLNSDDILLPNALEAVGGVFEKYPEIHWVVGNTSLINESGTLIRSSPSRPHSRIRFLCGDFRWIQQESTFWSRALWEKSGATLDASFQLALDFELWLRFFEHARPYPLEAGLGAFRFRSGQRSATQYDRYLNEVEGAILKARSRISNGYAEYFRDQLAIPLEIASPVDTKSFGARFSHEDVQPIRFEPQLGSYSNSNVKNYSPHLSPRRAPSVAQTEDVIASLPPQVFLKHRFSTRGDDLSELANKHEGEQCVIVGNGPSLNLMDHSVFENSTILAANSIFLLFDKVKWRPAYYSCVDTRVLPDIATNIAAMRRELGSTKCFFPSELHVYDGTGRTIDTRKLLPADENTYFFKQVYIDRDNLPDGAFSTDLNQYAYVPSTVTITLMQIAAYLGFSEILLIGCDTSYVIPPTVRQSGPEASRGEKLLLTSTEDDDPNHFDKSYFGKGKAWHNPKVEDMIWHYQQAREVLARRGINVLNATVGGKLEVFERVNYLDAVRKR